MFKDLQQFNFIKSKCNQEYHKLDIIIIKHYFLKWEFIVYNNQHQNLFLNILKLGE